MLAWLVEVNRRRGGVQAQRSGSDAPSTREKLSNFALFRSFLVPQIAGLEPGFRAVCWVVRLLSGVESSGGY